MRPETRVDTRVVKDIADYYAEIGFKTPEFYPIIGQNFPVTWAGVHADGMIKNPEIYASYDLKAVIGTPNRAAINQYSGSSGAAWKINELYKLTGDDAVRKDDPRLFAMVEEINKEYNEGRVTSFSDAEILKLTQKHLPGLKPAECTESPGLTPSLRVSE
jgi:isopropylmalate/homocitrate/citramalate synthase